MFSVKVKKTELLLFYIIKFKRFKSVLNYDT